MPTYEVEVIVTEANAYYRTTSDVRRVTRIVADEFVIDDDGILLFGANDATIAAYPDGAWKSVRESVPCPDERFATIAEVQSLIAQITPRAVTSYEVRPFIETMVKPRALRKQ